MNTEKQIDDGGPAFPNNDQYGCAFTGMTLRDWFAGKAYRTAWMAMESGYYEGGNEEVAECAYQMADAMIAARNKPKS